MNKDKTENTIGLRVGLMSPKLTRRVKMGNQSIVLTGILPKSEITSKPIWQSGSGKTT